LILDNEAVFSRWRWYFLGSMPVWILYAVLRTMETAGSWEFWLQAGRLFSFVLGFLNFMLGFALFMESLDRPVRQAIFDRGARYAVFTRQVM